MLVQSEDPGRIARYRACIGACLAGVAIVFAATLVPVAKAQGPEVFEPTGAQQSYVVPPDVSLVSIEAIGAAGGAHCGGGAGGLGAQVSAELAVSPGSVLYVEVGDFGAPGVLPGGACSTTPETVFNGGGAGGSVGAGGGGGASDVRTVPMGEAGSLGSRLIVAGGGGGGAFPASVGGDAGSDGGGPVAGGGATLIGPGDAGAPHATCAASATPGAFGPGGAGVNDFPNNGGGGGGGGYWGGGGGGCLNGSGSGGGGGSSYVSPQAFNASAVTTIDAPPSVTITPIEPEPLPVGPQGPPGPQGPAGPQGPTGSPGSVVTIQRLILAAFDERLRTRPGARVTLRYVTTVPAAVELAVLRGRRTVARTRGRAKAGSNGLRLRVPRASGRYRLVLSARAGGRTATDTIRLTVTRPRR